MLDNFGMGEFFMLALLALLFFGPERLPQIGATLGRWIAKLTSYSRTFMTEWREEALAIQEAVAEVRGIRDEIIAAQQEISGSLQTARADVVESIDLAKEAVTDARLEIEHNLQNQQQMAARDLDTMAREEAARRKMAQSESAAVDKSQQILDALRRKQETPSTEAGSESATPEPVSSTTQEVEPGTTQAAPSTPSLSSEEDDWERNRRAIQEIMSRSKRPQTSLYGGPAPTGVLAPSASASAAPSTSAPPVPAPAAEPAAKRSKDVASEPPVEAAAAPEEAVKKEPRETAFDRTQKILDSLSRRRSGEEPAQKEQAGEVVESAPEVQATTPVQEAVPAREVRETAFDRSQQILDNLKKRRSTAATPAERVAEQVSPPAADRQMFEQLQAQVASLHDEIAVLRREMEAIRSAARSAADELAVEEAI